MPYIRVISPAGAVGDTQEAYRGLRELLGMNFAPRVLQLFSLRPASMRRMIRCWELSNWMGDEPRQTREFVASAVSLVNQCHY